MGKYAEAAAAIERAESVRDSCKIDSDTVGLMLDVVKYRITHADYIHDENYGTLLTECFERCSAKLHAGYAAFHGCSNGLKRTAAISRPQSFWKASRANA